MTTLFDAGVGAEGRTAYAAIGGRDALTAAVDRFYDKLLADPDLAPLFPRGAGERHRTYVVTILGEALGGPERYRGPDIARTHCGLGISEAHFQQAGAHLAATLDELGVPGPLADQVIGIVVGLQGSVVTV
jgi:hemoglobin